MRRSRPNGLQGQKGHDLEEVWKDMIKKSGIDVMDLLTSGEGALVTAKKFEPPAVKPKG